MKKIWYLFAAVCTLSFMACEDADPVGIDSGSELEVLSVDEKIELTGGSGVIKIKTTATEIVATSDAEWLTITKWTPTAVGFEATENTEGAKRVANITISGDRLKVVVKVTQNGPQIDLGFEETTFEAGGGTGEIPFTVEGADVSARSHVDWLTVDKVEDGKIFFTVKEYGLKNQRAGAITVKAGDVTSVVTIYQNGSYFEMSGDPVTLSSNGSAATEIPYTTNLSSDPQVVMTPADAAEWLTVSFADGKMLLTPKANFTTDREVSLAVTAGWQSVTIKATQGVIALFDTQKFLVDCKEYTFDVKATEDLAYAASSWNVEIADGATWYTVTKNSDGFTVNIPANDTKATRESSIKLVGADGEQLLLFPVRQIFWDYEYFIEKTWTLHHTSNDDNNTPTTSDWKFYRHEDAELAAKGYYQVKVGTRNYPITIETEEFGGNWRMPLAQHLPGWYRTVDGVKETGELYVSATSKGTNGWIPSLTDPNDQRWHLGLNITFNCDGENPEFTIEPDATTKAYNGDINGFIFFWVRDIEFGDSRNFNWGGYKNATKITLKQ